jgi:hypothetical protein
MIRQFLARVAIFGFAGACVWACVWLCLKSSPDAAVVVGDQTLISIAVMAAAVIAASIFGTFRGDKR